MTSNVRRIGISEAYDYRVALPLVVVAVLGLLFVEVNGHKPITLHSNPSSNTTKKLIQPVSTPSVKAASNLPSLNPNVTVEDLAPGESPLDVQTTSPQSSSSSSSSASTSNLNSLQHSSSSTTLPTSSPVNNQPSQADIENLINGTTNEVINVTNGLNGTIKSLL